MCLSMFKATFEAADEPLDLVKLWQSLDGNPNNFTGWSGFVKLAICILSMVPNSAGAEQVFSAFSFAHTKHCNKLNSQKETGKVKKQKQRHFSSEDDSKEVFSNSLAPSPASTFLIITSDLISKAITDEQDSYEHFLQPEELVSTLTYATPALLSSDLANYVKIPFEMLFNFPPGTDSELEFCWKGGIRTLDEEEIDLGEADADTGNLAIALDQALIELTVQYHMPLVNGFD
ncbi:MAG: hypothetical protein NXY57DRAFT_1042749 [Lentinula lateritia]|nr:MAG: hypothetical protein NXY57DRAFT_1042749 [Lentinula lateritia]